MNGFSHFGPFLCELFQDKNAKMFSRNRITELQLKD